jgi:hypothetical protein
MAERAGEWTRGLAEAATALAVRDGGLADADRLLIDVVAGVYRIATESIRRIEAVQAEVEAIGESSAPHPRECARHLLDRNREIIAVLSSARSAASTKTVELQQLSQHYTS